MEITRNRKYLAKIAVKKGKISVNNRLFNITKAELLAHLDISLKLASVLSILCILWGGYLFYVYLSSQHLTFKFAELFVSANTILAFSIIGLITCLLLFMVLHGTPYLYRMIKIELHSRADTEKARYSKDFIVMLLSMSAMLIFSDKLRFSILINLILVLTLVRPNTSFMKNHTFAFLWHTASLVFILLLYVFPLFILNVLNNSTMKALTLNDEVGYFTMLLLIGIYSAFSSIIVNKNISSKTIYAIAILIIILVSSYAPKEFSTSIIKALGVGQYKHTISVTDEADKSLMERKGYKDVRHLQNTIPFYKEVFVILKMPSFIAIKPNDLDNEIVVLGSKQLRDIEIIDLDKPNGGL